MQVGLFAFAVIGVALCVPSKRYYTKDVKGNQEIKEAIVAEIVQETLQKKKKVIKEDFEVEGFGCDVCLKAIYGINYNLAHLKSSAEDMVKKDCQALFGGDNEAVGACITIMIDKIDEYYEKVEPMIDTKLVCIKIGMCVRKETPTLGPISAVTSSTTSRSSETTAEFVSLQSSTEQSTTDNSYSTTSDSSSNNSRSSSTESSPVKPTESQPSDPDFPSSTQNAIMQKVEKVFLDLL